MLPGPHALSHARELERTACVTVPLPPMSAFTFDRPGRAVVVKRPRPQVLHGKDVIVRMESTSICPADADHIGSAEPDVRQGRILGHEGVGIVSEVGPAVRRHRLGERVVISSLTACGECPFCRRGLQAHCQFGGWLLGEQIDGTHAEYVRVPYADTSTFAVPADLPAPGLSAASELLPTAFECGILNGTVNPHDTVVVIGAGPIAQAALALVRAQGARVVAVIDEDSARLRELEARVGVDVAAATDAGVAAKLRALTDGGVDAVIYTLGAQHWPLASELIRDGGRIALIGAHAESGAFQLEQLWRRGVGVSTGSMSNATIPELLRLIADGRIDVASLFGARYEFSDIVRAYQTSGAMRAEHGRKVQVDFRAASIRHDPA